MTEDQFKKYIGMHYISVNSKDKNNPFWEYLGKIISVDDGWLKTDKDVKSNVLLMCSSYHDKSYFFFTDLMLTELGAGIEKLIR
jgi:hypothetical protein